LTLSSFTTPPCDAGIFMDALSLSTVIRLCSGLMVSPGFSPPTVMASALAGELLSFAALRARVAAQTD